MATVAGLLMAPTTQLGVVPQETGSDSLIA